MGLQLGPAEGGGVQPQVLGGRVGGGHDPVHLRRDHVPRGQVAARVPPGHDRPPGPVDEHGARAAQGLGDERPLALPAGLPQHGGVELHELQPGQRGAGPGGQGQPVAGRPGRVGRGRVGLPVAAGGQHDRRGADDPGGQRPAVAGQGAGQQAGDLAALVQQRVERDHGVADLHAGAGQHRVAQRPVHLGPGGVTARVHDPRPRVPALQAQRAGVEPRAQCGQPADLAGRRGHQHRHRLVVAQPGARGQRVLAVQAR